jgi:hypothetical protein
MLQGEPLKMVMKTNQAESERGNKSFASFLIHYVYNGWLEIGYSTVAWHEPCFSSI